MMHPKFTQPSWTAAAYLCEMTLVKWAKAMYSLRMSLVEVMYRCTEPSGPCKASPPSKYPRVVVAHCQYPNCHDLHAQH